MTLSILICIDLIAGINSLKRKIFECIEAAASLGQFKIASLPNDTPLVWWSQHTPSGLHDGMYEACHHPVGFFIL
jgi:hypothetical protein